MKVFIGNIPFSIEAADLREAFECFGRVEDICLPRHNDGSKKGFAFIEYSSDDAAQAAIAAMDGSRWDGRTLQVSIAKPRGVR